MPFSTANLAVVAYALVESDGTSPEINSGVTTTFVANQGVYHIILPGSENMSLPEPLQQGQGVPGSPLKKRDLIIVTPQAIGPPPAFSVTEVDEFTKVVNFGENSHTEFAIVILRPVVPTPTDINGVQNGPT